MLLVQKEKQIEIQLASSFRTLFNYQVENLYQLKPHSLGAWIFKALLNLTCTYKTFCYAKHLEVLFTNKK